MKNSVGITVIFIALISLGWISFLLTPKNKVDNEIKAHMDQAEDYINRGLYQKAIEEYDAANQIREDERIWELKMDAHNSLYEWNSDDFYNSFLTAAEEAAKKYPMNADFQTTLADLYLVKEDYVSAYKSLSKAIEFGNNDQKVLDYRFKVKYAFKLEVPTYSDYHSCLNGSFSVCKRGEWFYLTASDLTNESGKVYDFTGPINRDGLRLVSFEGRCFLMNSKSVIQGIEKFIPEASGIFADGLIPIKYEDKYHYYDILGDVQFDKESYDYAGSFSNGTAAVCKDNKWFIIDKNGEAVDDKIYDDVVLFLDGTYTKDNVKIFKYSGKYHLIVKDEERGEFDDVDILTDDGLIAVCVNGKWGFVNLEGEMKIEPKYLEAKSFSNGLAAVFNGTDWGFINKDGELAIDYQFLDVDYFDNCRNCLVASYIEDQMIVPYDEPVDGEILEVEYDTRLERQEDGSVQVVGTKTLTVRIKIWQVITIYNEI